VSQNKLFGHSQQDLDVGHSPISSPNSILHFSRRLRILWAAALRDCLDSYHPPILLISVSVGCFHRPPNLKVSLWSIHESRFTPRVSLHNHANLSAIPSQKNAVLWVKNTFFVKFKLFTNKSEHWQTEHCISKCQMVMMESTHNGRYSWCLESWWNS
jgi:hypothetical protein